MCLCVRCACTHACDDVHVHVVCGYCICMCIVCDVSVYVHVHSLSCVCAYAALAHMLVLMCMRMCTYVLSMHVTNARMCPIFVSCMCVCVFVSVCMSVCMYVCGHVLMGACVYAAFTHVSTDVCYMRTIHVRPYMYMWHMMATSLDHVVQKEQAVEGLKAAHWQQPAQPSGACTLCSSS